MIKPGDTVTRIWGNNYMRSEMRVSFVDDEFIYCNAQRNNSGEPWMALPIGAALWKFDRKYGVETDEEQGWGIEPYGRNILLTRIVERKEDDAT